MKLFTSLILALSLLLTSPPQAEAAGCRNAGPKQNNLTLGSQVDGKIFTICADQATIKKTTNTKGKTKPQPVRTNPKVNPVGQVVFSYQKFGNSTRVTFKPVPPKLIRVTSGQLSLNQQVDFKVDQSVKLGANWVFGNRLGVRFTPISVTTKFSDGQVSATFNPNRSFAQPGVYQLRAVVTYRVEYRKLHAGEYVNKKGAKWILDPGTIALASNPVTIQIGNTPRRAVVLVSQ